MCYLWHASQWFATPGVVVFKMFVLIIYRVIVDYHLLEYYRRGS